jgi:hypothetical protein
MGSTMKSKANVKIGFFNQWITNQGTRIEILHSKHLQVMEVTLENPKEKHQMKHGFTMLRRYEVWALLSKGNIETFLVHCFYLPDCQSNKSKVYISGHSTFSTFCEHIAYIIISKMAH